MAKGNIDNLKPIPFKENDERTKEAGRKGGIKSGETKRRKKLLKEELETLLEIIDKDGHTNQEKISMALLQKASKGDTRAFEVIRSTIGQDFPRQVQVQEVPTIIDDIQE